MYPVSNEFHEAVKNGNEQKALLIFNDCVFTDDDIAVDRGIEFHDYFNTEEDLSIGQATSNEISFSLFNDERLLNDYEFGDFLATLGVFIRSSTYQQTSSVMLTTNNARWLGAETPPFVRRNNNAVSSQPSFAVKSMLGYDNKVWVFSGTGLYAVYDDKTGANITPQNRLNNFMKAKSKQWNSKGIFYNKSTRMLHIFQGGVKREYEFCPLGWFTAERPKAPDVIQIDMTCYDWMQKFEKDMPDAKTLGISYPVTIWNLLNAICKYAGVQNGMTGSFINSGAKITKAPDEFNTATMRDVVKWIAEAAAGNAVIDRNGALKLKWLTDTSLLLEATNYSEFNPYWYETKKITKLYNRESSGASETTVGTGDEGYLIQDNPLLKGVK
jgi:hypothetical protein